LRETESRDVIYELVERSDVVVNNFRVGVMERLGFGYERLREINPRIIYAFGSGFGEKGPYVHKGGQDVLAQALTGAMARKADPSHPLAIYATALADYTAGMLMVQGILLSLIARERSGIGQKINVSLFDALLAMQHQEATVSLMRQRELNWAAMPLNGVFHTTDGAIVIIGAFKEHPLRDICQALELPDLSTDPRYATFEQQKANRTELQRTFADRIATSTTSYWLKRLEDVDILSSEVLSLEQTLESEQVAVNEMIWSIQHPALGLFKTLGNPLKLSETPAQVRRYPPRLGEHTSEVLEELGIGGSVPA
jgi:formyl-CoA transferase